jgi:hypothetical protein
VLEVVNPVPRRNLALEEAVPGWRVVVVARRRRTVAILDDLALGDVLAIAFDRHLATLCCHRSRHEHYDQPDQHGGDDDGCSTKHEAFPPVLRTNGVYFSALFFNSPLA